MGREVREKLAEGLLRKHAGAAEEAFQALGEMKGLALKMGQMLSYMDGALPEGYRPAYQEALTRLQRSAPPLAWSAVEPVLVAELGGPITTTYAEFATEPFAAASIGQVHRAVLRSGESVAVKVQYPGVERAMNADLKNLDLVEQLVRPIVGGLSLGANQGMGREILAELRARLVEELDYEREATMQRRFAHILAGDPDIRIPRVFRDASSRRVLTTELVEGRTLQEVCDQDEREARDRYGTILTRGLLTCLYGHQIFNADPHPGNYLFPADGTVVLLDFGCVKEIPDWMHRDMKATLAAGITAVHADDPESWARFDAVIAQAYDLDPDSPVVWRVYREFLLFLLRPALRDEPFEFTPDLTRESFDRVAQAKAEVLFAGGVIPRIPELPRVPADYTFLNRLQWGFFSILAMLRARVNWHRLLPEEIRIEATSLPSRPSSPGSPAPPPKAP